MRSLVLASVTVLVTACSLVNQYEEVPGVGGTSCTTTEECIDAEPCTDDSCTAGSCQSTPQADGAPCQLGQGNGSCEGGACVIDCSGDPAVCDDANPCTVDSCDAVSFTCTRENLDNVTASTNVVGDCRIDLCVNGVLQAGTVDDQDVPVDGNDCTDDVCSRGAPSNAPLPSGTPCGTDLVCDGTGTCVGCTTPADCGTDTFCTVYTCANRECGVQYTADSTPLPLNQQNAGPCKELQCDGTGTIKTVDLPTSTPCNDQIYCNGGDSCLSGNCSQHAGNPCISSNGPDCSESCDEAADNCDAPDMDGSACNDSLYCNGSDNCQGGACSVHQGSPCPGQDIGPNCSDSCNESTDNCSGDDANGTGCSDGLFCTSVDSCMTGNCIGAGNPCPGHNMGPNCNDSCNENNNNCTGFDEYETPCGQFMTGCCNASGTCLQICP